jgi:hypothetical protein
MKAGPRLNDKEISMKTIAKIVTVVCFGSVLCLAETWSGKVVDSACKDKSHGAQPAQPGQATNACEPTAATTAFGIELADGKVLKLDGTGNAKAAEAVKSSNNKPGLMATVTGSLDGQTVKVESIDIK